MMLTLWLVAYVVLLLALKFQWCLALDLVLGRLSSLAFVHLPVAPGSLLARWVTHPEAVQVEIVEADGVTGVVSPRIARGHISSFGNKHVIY